MDYRPTTNEEAALLNDSKLKFISLKLAQALESDPIAYQAYTEVGGDVISFLALMAYHEALTRQAVDKRNDRLSARLKEKDILIRNLMTENFDKSVMDMGPG